MRLIILLLLSSIANSQTVVYHSNVPFIKFNETDSVLVTNVYSNTGIPIWWGAMGVTVANNDVLSYQYYGSNIIAETVGQRLFYSNVSTALVDGQIKYTSIYVPKPSTLTGMKVYVRVLGNYTGDNNNRIGLYRYNTTTGLLTLVASSANNSNLWKSAANAVQTIAFTTPYVAAPGNYVVAMIYNQSAQTTAPALASGVALNNLAMAGTALGFTNSAKLYGTSTGTDLPATINMSAITASVIPSWVAIY